MGAGVGLTINSQIRIATEKSLFAMPETQIGFFPDTGASRFLTRGCNPELGLFMALTGHRIKGSELLDWGFATNYIKSEKMEYLKGLLAT